MLWQSIPVFLWPIVIEYYFKRLLGIRPSMLKSNWVYFLRIALPISISVRKLNGAYHISNPHTGLTSIVRPNSSDILVYIQIFFHKEYLRIEGLEIRQGQLLLIWVPMLVCLCCTVRANGKMQLLVV